MCGTNILVVGTESMMWAAGILSVLAGTASTAKYGLQASSSSPQAPQALRNVGCRHPLRAPQAPQTRQNVGCRHPRCTRRHRRHCKMWVAGTPLVLAGTAGTAKRRLQASSSSPQAPQALRNVGCRHPLGTRRHRRHGKMWGTGIHLFGAGTTGTVKRGLQASTSLAQAPQAR